MRKHQTFRKLRKLWETELKFQIWRPAFIGLRTTALAWLIVSGALAFSTFNAEALPRVVTFVQLTDAHLFDAENDAAQIANQTAWNWAVLRINQRMMSGQAIDFVAVTGGLGVEALAVEEREAAVLAIAPALRALLVERIFWIPGGAAVDKDFVELLDKATPEHEVIDASATAQEVNGIHFLGLAVGSAGDGSLELDRLQSDIKTGEPHVVLADIPDVADKVDPTTGAALPLWQSEELRRRWTELARSPEVAAVLVGGVHFRQRAPYEKMYAPSFKTRVSPSIGSRDAQELEPLPRGLLRVTVSHSGAVEAEVIWMPPAEAKSKDKEGQLVLGRIALEHWQLGEAETAFKAALDSEDTDVRREAEEDLKATRKKMRGIRWRLIEGLAPARSLARYWLLGILLLICIPFLVGFVKHRYRQRTFIISSPQQLTESAPAKLWLAELSVAAENLRQILRREGQYWYASQQGSFSRPSAIAQEIGDALPTLQGVDTGKIYKFLQFLGRLLSWRFESEVAGTNQKVTVYIFLKWAWMTKAAWRVPGVHEPSLDIATAARRVAADGMVKLLSPAQLHDRFSDCESLSLFVEAVEYFQSYHQHPSAEKLEAALRSLETCRQRYPNDLLPQFYLGLVKIEQSYSGLDEAIELFERIRESDDEALKLDATYNLGIANIELYTPDGNARARSLLSEAIEIAKRTGTSRSLPVKLHAMVLLAYMDAESLQKIDQPTEASESTAKKLETTLERLKADLDKSKLPEMPKNYILSEYWNAKGLVARYRAITSETEDLRRDRREESEDYYKRALRHRKDWIPSLSNLAVLYQDRAEDMKKAIPLWNKVVEIRPDDQFSQFNLGFIYEKSDPEKARQHYKKAPKIPEAQEALERMNAEGAGIKSPEPPNPP